MLIQSALFLPCQDEIREFKDAFNLIDQNHDGFIDKTDLRKMFASLRKDISDELLENMIKEAPEKINFSMLLILFGEKLMGTNPTEIIINTFKCFDQDNTEYVPEFWEWLTTMEDCMTHKQVNKLFADAPIVDENFNYVEFFRMLKHGTKEMNDA